MQRNSAIKTTGLIALLVFTSLTLGACMRPQAPPGELLVEALRSYHNDLLFMRYDQASVHLTPEHRREFLRYYQDREEPINIMEYEILRLEVDPEEHYAEALVEFAWYQLPSTSVQRTRLLERWSFDEDSNLWTIIEQIDKPIPTKSANANPQNNILRSERRGRPNEGSY